MAMSFFTPQTAQNMTWTAGYAPLDLSTLTVAEHGASLKFNYFTQSLYWEVVATWQPTNARMWLLMEDAYLTKSDATHVTQLLDKIGTYNSNTNTGVIPELVSIGPNGKVALRFRQPTPSFFQINNALPTDGTDHYTCTLIRINAVATPGVYAFPIINNLNGYNFTLSSSGSFNLPDRLFCSRGGTNSTQTFASLGITLNDGDVWVCTVRHSGSNSYFYINGVEVESFSAGTYGSPYNFVMGANDSGFAFPLSCSNIDVCELICSTTASDYQRCEGYLCWKYGFVSILDPSHPYFANPPLA